MRLNRATLAVLFLTVLILAPTSPASAAGVRDCKLVFATLNTTFVEEFVEVGPVEGTITGAAYLRYDDDAPPVDPRGEKANFVITDKAGTINLWVYSQTKMDGDLWWRDFEVLYSEGTGVYANQRILLEIYGMCSLKGGAYEIEGMICRPLALPPKK